MSDDVSKWHDLNQAIEDGHRAVGLLSDWLMLVCADQTAGAPEPVTLSPDRFEQLAFGLRDMDRRLTDILERFVAKSPA